MHILFMFYVCFMHVLYLFYTWRDLFCFKDTKRVKYKLSLAGCFSTGFGEGDCLGDILHIAVLARGSGDL